MCTRPIQIDRVNPVTNSVDSYTVPCGKCDECLLQKQREFACLAVLESQLSSSVHLVTLTYSNRTVPIMVTEKESGYSHFIDKGREFFVEMCTDKDGSLMSAAYKDLDVCPSLRRSDFRLFLKRVRIRYKREFGECPTFRYAGFGEYGSQTFRPHYHFLFFDCPARFVNFFAAEWRKEYGFSDVKYVNCINKDGSPGYVKVARYVSKYVAKPKKHFPWIADGLCEPPSQTVQFRFRHTGLEYRQVERFLLGEGSAEGLPAPGNKSTKKRPCIVRL